MIEPFLCRVSHAGVPHTITHSLTQDYSVYGLSAKSMCKLYWTLSKLTISYTFSANDVSLSRTFFAQTMSEPRDRLLVPPDIYNTGYDSEYDTSYLCRLNLDTIYLLPDGTFGLKLMVNEIDSTDSVNLNTFQMENMASISCDFHLLEGTGKMFLNYDTNVITSASIEQFNIELSFMS